VSTPGWRADWGPDPEEYQPLQEEAQDEPPSRPLRSPPVQRRRPSIFFPRSVSKCPKCNGPVSVRAKDGASWCVGCDLGWLENFAGLVARIPERGE
jgi:hypothetical protein